MTTPSDSIRKVPTAIQATDAIPLRAMRYTGRIEGLQAELNLQLSYENKLPDRLEAIFTLPLPSQAKVLGVDLKIGEKTIRSELRKREDATRIYNDALHSGNDAALMEQEREDTFTMSVGGIDPGEKVEVSVRYHQQVDWQNSGGRIRIPTVVAPRFIPGIPISGRQGGGWSPDTHLVPDASRVTPLLVSAVPYDVSIDLQLRAGFSLKLCSPSHEMLLPTNSFEGDAVIPLRMEGLRPDRDIIVEYQTTSLRPEVTLTCSDWVGQDQVEKEFTLVQVLPPLAPIKRPRDVVLCLDCSGSMEGASIVGLREVVRRSIELLDNSPDGKNVRLGIVMFSTIPQVLVPLSKLGEQHRAVVSELKAGGDTYAGVAIDKSMTLFDTLSSERECSLIVLSDGQTHDRAFSARTGVRLHTVGIGSAVGDEFLTSIARDHGGLTYWVRQGEDYDRAAASIVARTWGPIVRDLKVLVEGKEITAVGDRTVFEGSPATIVFETSAGKAREVAILGTGVDGAPFSIPLALDVAEPRSDIARLTWAKELLRGELDGELSTAISLEHGILCSSTAFVAVHDRVEKGGAVTRVDVPVLLPDGWSFGGADYAMYASLGAAYAGIDSVDCLLVEFTDCDIDSNPSPDDLDAEELARGVSDPTSRSIKPVDPIEGVLYDLKLYHCAILSGTEVVGDTPSWRDLSERLQYIEVSGYPEWSEFQKAELLLQVCQLRKLGVQISVPQGVRGRPGDALAAEIWGAAQREMGVNVNV